MAPACSWRGGWRDRAGWSFPERGGQRRCRCRRNRRVDRAGRRGREQVERGRRVRDRLGRTRVGLPGGGWGAGADVDAERRQALLNGAHRTRHFTELVTLFRELFLGLGHPVFLVGDDLLRPKVFRHFPRFLALSFQHGRLVLIGVTHPQAEDEQPDERRRGADGQDDLFAFGEIGVREFHGCASVSLTTYSNVASPLGRVNPRSARARTFGTRSMNSCSCRVSGCADTFRIR